MREIRFRAWDNEEKNFIYFDALDGILSKCDETYRQRCVGKFEQFTGVYDKNGKEIYEGDIVFSKNWNPERYEVVFDRGGFCLKWGNDSTYYPDIKYSEDMAVIGNIYENPGVKNG